MDQGPIRTCAGCRRKRPRWRLIRVARLAEGEPRVGPGPGRGAYLCFDPRCVKRALETGSLGRALRVRTQLPSDLGARLLEIASSGQARHQNDERAVREAASRESSDG